MPRLLRIAFVGVSFVPQFTALSWFAHEDVVVYYQAAAQVVMAMPHPPYPITMMQQAIA